MQQFPLGFSNTILRSSKIRAASPINGRDLNSLLTPHPVYLNLGNTKASRLRNYCSLFDSSTDEELFLDIRYSLNKGLVLGAERFKTEVEAVTKRRVRPKQRKRIDL